MKELKIKDMRKLMILVVMEAAFVLPTMAQSAPEWQTSSMKGSGSQYSSQVTPIGAPSVASEATTTESYTPGRPGAIRRDSYNDDDWGTNPQIGEGNEGSPIGDAFLPLLMFAAAFTGVIYLRRKRSRNACER